MPWEGTFLADIFPHQGRSQRSKTPKQQPWAEGVSVGEVDGLAVADAVRVREGVAVSASVLVGGALGRLNEGCHCVCRLGWWLACQVKWQWQGHGNLEGRGDACH